MRAIMQVNKPDKIEVTLTWTMDVSEWRALRDGLEDKWPEWAFRHDITTMINQMEKNFYPKDSS